MTSALLISPIDSRSAAFHYFFDFCPRRHRRIAVGPHRQRAMRRAAFNRPLHPLPREQPVDQSTRKRITAAAPIEDLEVLAHWRLVKLTARITNCAPIV